MSPASPTRPALVDALVHLAREHPLDRKLILTPSFGVGRELLRTVARETGGWIGLEVTTLSSVASRLAGDAVERSGRTPVDAFEQQALLDQALDAALGVRALRGVFDELAEGVGFRSAVHNAAVAVRLAGIPVGRLRGTRLDDPRKRALLAETLERYEILLHERARADTATLYRWALEALEAHASPLDRLGVDALLVVPGISGRGLGGDLLRGLLARGARILPTDPVRGAPPPSGWLWEESGCAGPFSHLHDPEGVRGPGPRVELFRAASVNDEIKEVVRRVIASGCRWDEVEIVTTDAAAYGSAMHALATRLGIPATYAVGLPVERTRAGRVAKVYLDWIAGGFQADPIRRLLEAGDLRPHGRLGAGTLARRFRSLRIGWGRERYRARIAGALDALDALEPGSRESAEHFENRKSRVQAELEALRAILFPPLRATPRVPDRAETTETRVAPAELASGLKSFLKRVPPGSGPDAVARDEILRRLDRVEAELHRKTRFDAALTILRGYLEIRVRARREDREADVVTDAGAPWRSEGGHIHVTDVEHGGLSGRPMTFIVGVDADRFPGPVYADPILPDSDRRALGTALPPSGDLLAEKTFRFAALFARLRGQVTVSYSAWSAAEARTVGASPAMVRALRLQRGDGALTFADLDGALGQPACVLPRLRPAVDPDDVWMEALDGESVLREGLSAVRAAYPHLDRGLTALATRREGEPSAHHGLVEPRPGLLDPRESDEIVVSASRLEDLGACPLRYLLRVALHVTRPDDPVLDPDRWLDAGARGSLLHRVFEAALRGAREHGLDPESDEFRDLALRELDAAVACARVQVPVPGEAVFRREREALGEDVRIFVRMIREHGADWVALELRFGVRGDPPVVLELEGGPLHVRGAIDRVDEGPEGLRVVDYKTGVPRAFDPASGTFNGGRRLQHAIYAVAAERLLGRPVVSGEYHFPTRRGENLRASFPRARLEGVSVLLGTMLDGVASGSFIPTDDPSDCGYCDYAEICRARSETWSDPSSPLAEWSRHSMETRLMPPFRALRKVRTFEG